MAPFLFINVIYIMWKDNIRQQLDKAKLGKDISKSLKALATNLLNFDDEFCLVYLSGRECYTRIIFKERPGKNVRKFILTVHGSSTYKLLVPTR